MKYYISADIHGFYTDFHKALDETGYFSVPEPHKLIILGDIFDRGQEAVEMQRFILELLEQDAVILIRGNHEDLFGGWRVTVNKFLCDRVMTKIHEYNQKAMLNAGKKGFTPIEISDDGLELIEYLSLDCTSAAGEWHSDSEIKIDKLGYVIRNGVKTKDFWDGTITS